MNGLFELTEVEIRMGFAASCVEALAQKVGCSYKEMYRRMKAVGLIQGLTRHLDPLHTQSREYVTDELLKALERLESGKRKEEGVC